MANHDHYFDEKQAAAVLKHGVLANYVRIFGVMTSLQNQARRAWFIDAYAGAGKYESGDAGSPLIALQAARALQSIKDPRDLRCIFIEQDQKNFAELTRVVIATNQVPPPTLIEGPADGKLPEAVAQVGTDPLLTFLDPFGTSLPRNLMVETLLKRPGDGISEVLLNFHLGSVARIGPFASDPDKLDDGDRKTLERLDLFLGYEDWRDIFLKSYQKGVPRTATAGAQEVAKDYRARIQHETGYLSFPVEVRKARGQVPIFELTLFFKGDSPAEYKFADAASYANAAWRKRVSEDEARTNAAKYSNALISLGDEFSASQFESSWKADEKRLSREWTDGLKANLRSLQPRFPLRVQGNLGHIFGEFLGLAGEKHLRAAWNELATEGILTQFPKKPHYSTLAHP